MLYITSQIKPEDLSLFSNHKLVDRMTPIERGSFKVRGRNVDNLRKASALFEAFFPLSTRYFSEIEPERNGDCSFTYVVDERIGKTKLEAFGDLLKTVYPELQITMQPVSVHEMTKVGRTYKFK